MSTGQLFTIDGPTRTAREWGRWLPVPRPPDCPDVKCAAPLVTMPSAIQPALFLHGGYGAAEQSVRKVCPRCGWTMTVETNSINPRKLEGGA